MASDTPDETPLPRGAVHRVGDRIQRWLGRVGRNEFLILAIGACVVGGIWGFVEIAEEVTEGETRVIDETILLAMRNSADRSDPIGPGWVEEIGRDFTALGGVAVLVFVTIAACGWLALDRKIRTMFFVIVAVGGGDVLSALLKNFFDRPRPDLVPHGSIVYTTSFPSGHAMMSAVTYLTLGAILARVQPRYRLKAYLFILAGLLTFAVGVSRVYLGVHWPTDVLAGWAVGSAWALLCWLVARFLQRRGQIEVEPGEEEEDDLHRDPELPANEQARHERTSARADRADRPAS